MYSRISHYQMNPANTDDVVALMPDLKEKISQVPGLVSCTSSWREDGQGCSIAVYESKEAADAAASKVSEIWGGLAQYLTAAPTAVEYENVEDMMN